ncbi:MAG: TFIIB-type zinc ribbon-containing protein [Oscillospiraceae bacterium]|nr:TFIIB-type zinc ribbon-containing protein [Oscillospiraceae bacterium]
MAVVTYKCPNCGGGLKFDPASQKFACEYCLSKFDEEALKDKFPLEKEPEAEEPSSRKEAPSEEAVVYNCPSCGAQVVTCETTAATFCFYCHNPVVLAGRLEGRYLPEKIIPFAVPKEKVTQDLKNWLKSKSFVPRGFFSDDQVEKLTGVYFPHWMVDCDVHASVEGTGRNLRLWRIGDIEYTETSLYNISRKADIHFKDITKTALKKADAQLVEGVQPYDAGGLKDFDMSFLSGFQAEKRDIEQEEMTAAVQQEVNEYAASMIRQQISGYDSVSLNDSRCTVKKTDWSYSLLPVWVLAYRDKATNKLYHYAVNGQTGKVCGEAPVDKRKLNLATLGVGLASFLILMLIGWWLR